MSVYFDLIDFFKLLWHSGYRHLLIKCFYHLVVVGSIPKSGCENPYALVQWGQRTNNISGIKNNMKNLYMVITIG